MLKKIRSLALIAPCCALVACGSQESRDAGKGPAEVTIAITKAPADVDCIRVAAAGSTTQVANIPVTLGQDTVFKMTGLPTGAVSFYAEAFPGACGSTEATWVSDAVTVTLKPGNNGKVTLPMHGRANINVAVDFPGFGPGDWVSIDGSQPGTPADVVADSTSDASATTLHVKLHGLFMAERVGPDNVTYAELLVPGMPNLTQPGAPALPAVRGTLAMINGGTLQLEDFSVAASLNFTRIAWPATRPERDATVGGAPGSLPELFMRDDKIYGGGRQYPDSPASFGEPGTVLGGINGADFELHPVVYDPQGEKITVFTDMTFRMVHRGTEQGPDGINREQLPEASAIFVNWAAIADKISVFPVYHGRFLFIYPPGYDAAMAPLVAQKWSRGFIVTELTTAETGSTCSGIRAAIKSWHDSSGGSGDYYAILVGDTNVIPLCTGPVSSIATDDLYGSTNGNDLEPEVFVGRFSVNSTAEASDQVTKTLSYEETPDSAFNYGKALLVAHKQDAPGKYVGAHEAVRTAAYAVPPTFSTLYGHIPGVNNASVSSAIGMGQGLVAYRGHGSDIEWWDWNTSDQSYFYSPDVNSLANSITPIVWSIACSNAALNSSPSIAETWMKTPHNRAVAHYGATEASWTEANHKLDYYLFQAVYNLNMTTHAKAIRYAEKMMTAWDPGAGGENAWKYLLLGDPEMRIRRRPARTIGSIIPLGRLTFMVVDAQGNAIQDANVSFSQPLRLAGATLGNTVGARMALNAYTNADGIVSFDAQATEQFVVEAHTPLLDDVLSIEVEAEKPQ